MDGRRGVGVKGLILRQECRDGQFNREVGKKMIEGQTKERYENVVRGKSR